MQLITLYVFIITIAYCQSAVEINSTVGMTIPTPISIFLPSMSPETINVSEKEYLSSSMTQNVFLTSSKNNETINLLLNPTSVLLEEASSISTLTKYITSVKISTITETSLSCVTLMAHKPMYSPEVTNSDGHEADSQFTRTIINTFTIHPVTATITPTVTKYITEKYTVTCQFPTQTSWTVVQAHTASLLTWSILGNLMKTSVIPTNTLDVNTGTNSQEISTRRMSLKNNDRTFGIDEDTGEFPYLASSIAEPFWF